MAQSHSALRLLSTGSPLVLALALSCSLNLGKNKGGDGDGDSLGDGDGDGDTSGDGDAPGDGGSPGDGDTSGSGGAGQNGSGGTTGILGVGDENEGGGATPPDLAGCAITSTISDLGGAYDTQDNNGPESHSAMYGAKPRLIPAPRVDGSFDIAWQTSVGADTLYITHVEESGGTYSAAWHLAAPSLGILGGLAVDANGEPVVVTAVDESIASDIEPSETHRPNIMQIVRLGSDCMEIYRQDLRTDFDGDADRLPLYSPFNAGTSRLAVGGGTYVVHFSQNTEFDPGVNQRHQIGRYIVGSSASGAVTHVQNNISHSFDQRVRFDGTGFVSLSLGDASLRGIAMSYTTTGGEKTQRTLFAIKGGDSATGGGYNNTFTRLGDVAPAQSGYVSVFSTEEETTHPERVSHSRNVGLVHSPSDFYTIDQPERYEVVISDTDVGNPNTQSWEISIRDYWDAEFSGHNRNIAWVTDYADVLTAHAERPKLVRWNANTFFVIWEKWTLEDYEATYAAVVDEWGNILVAPKSLGSARLPRGDDAFLINGRAAWLEGSGGNIILHLVDTELNHTAQTL